MGSTVPTTKFPPIRACLFDMDGLLLNTEDLYSECTNIMLARHGRPPLPWAVKAKLQGRPGPASAEIFQKWAQLPLSPSEFQKEVSALQVELFPTAVPLPGVEKLLNDLSRARVDIALATSCHKINFDLKSGHLKELFEVFSEKRRVLGDDIRIPKGRGKPAPDIYLLALEMVNETLPEGIEKIKPEESLVFEDSVPGVEAGRRAGMRVIWCPHPGLYKEFKNLVPEVLAGRADQEGAEKGRGAIGDGWADYMPSLENFPYEQYGIVVR